MTIRTETAQGICRIQLDRLDKKNAITAAMYQAMADALKAGEADAATRVFVIHGAPECFTAGNDLEDFMARPPQGDGSPVFQFLHGIAALTKPIVAAVSGPAVGIGTTMLLHCDAVYASDTAKFSMPFATLGLCPEAASSLLLPALCGYQRAAEKLLFGESFGATEAKEMGLVTGIVPPADLLAHAMSRAAKLVALPASSLRATKALMKQAQLPAIRQQMGNEGAEFGRLLRSPEAKEAFTAFFEKRKPDFSKFA